MKNKLTEVVNKTEIEEVSKTNKMCSCETNVVNDLCSSECVDTCGDVRTFIPQKPTNISTIFINRKIE